MKKRAISLLLVFCMFFAIGQPAFAYAQVATGSKGNDVKTLQTMLNTVDNAKLVADGIFGARTKRAVINFQKSNGLSADGICGPKTWAKLSEKYQNILNQAVAPATPAQKPSASSYPMVQNGSSGSAVRDLQTMLNAVIGAGLKVDGIFGRATKAAVLNFQRSNGLSADGICGPKTWAALIDKYYPGSQDAAAPSSITIGSGNYNPGSLVQGKTYSISGTISSAYPLNSVTVGIYYEDGAATSYTQVAYPRTTSYNIHSVDSYIRFGMLQPGTYLFRVSAVDSQAYQTLLVDNRFTVTTKASPALNASSLASVPGCEQIKNYCTSCAIVTMLRRKQFVDGRQITFNFDDVRVSAGAPRNNPQQDLPRFSMNGTWTDLVTVSSGSNTSYTTRSKGLYGDFAAKKGALAQMLDEHPEGVVLYARYPGSQHAITVSDYTTSGGDYQFYAYDPVTIRNYGTHRTTIENTYLCQANGGLKKTLDNLIGITYIA